MLFKRFTQGLSLCYALINGSAFTSNIVPQDVVDQVVTKLYMAHREHPEVISF